MAAAIEIIRQKLSLMDIKVERDADSTGYPMLLAFKNGRICEIASYNISGDGDDDDVGYEIYLSNGFSKDMIGWDEEDVVTKGVCIIRSFIQDDFFLNSRHLLSYIQGFPGKSFNYSCEEATSWPVKSWPYWFPEGPPGGLFHRRFPAGASMKQTGTDWVATMPLAPSDWLNLPHTDFSITKPWDMESGTFSLAQSSMEITFRLGRDWLESRLPSGMRCVTFSSGNDQLPPIAAASQIMRQAGATDGRMLPKWRCSTGKLTDDYVIVLQHPNKAEETGSCEA